MEQMKIQKVKLEREEYALTWGDNGVLPMSAVRGSLMFIFLFVAVALAYNTGHLMASEYMKWISYYAPNGIYDVETGLYERCDPYQNGNIIEWNCSKQEEGYDPFWKPLNITSNQT